MLQQIQEQAAVPMVGHEESAAGQHRNVGEIPIEQTPLREAELEARRREALTQWQAPLRRLHRRGRYIIEAQRVLRTTLLALFGGLVAVTQYNYWLHYLLNQYAIEPHLLGIQVQRTLVGIMLLSLAGAQLSVQGRRIAAALSTAYDTRTVGMLVDLLANGENRPLIVGVLKRLLPQLQASDASLLNTAQREGLLRELNRSAYRRLFKQDQPGFAVIILKALEQVGDASALPGVQKIAEAPAHAVWSVVRKAARECLPALQQRAEQQRATQTLLRPISVLPTMPNTLLRPVTSCADEDALTLLRADNPDTTTS